MNSIKKALCPAIFLLFASFGLNVFSQSALENLTTIKEGVKTRRISSYDRTGGNNDRFENIEPGETRILAEIEGAGAINHIWITISPEAPELNRSDVILRMYWDGNDFPSVESPIGPFFGQGWDETYPWGSLPLAASPAKGNALVSYFKMPFAKGARKGYLDPVYMSVAQSCFESILSEFIEIEEDGLVSINHGCFAAGLGGLNYRSGSYDYYVNERKGKNDSKSVGPFIMAAIELER